MAQISVGFINITTNNTYCDASVNVDWSLVKVGMWFAPEGQTTFLEIQSVAIPGPTGFNRLTFTAPYTGPTLVSSPYVIVTDFSPNAGLALINAGDVQTAEIFSRNMMQLDGSLGDDNAFSLATQALSLATSANSNASTASDDASQALTIAAAAEADASAALATVTGVSAPYYDAIVNGIFRFNQRSPAAAVSVPTGLAGPAPTLDRWMRTKSNNTLVGNISRLTALAQDDTFTGNQLFPRIDNALRFTTTTGLATVAAGDYLEIYQNVPYERATYMFPRVSSILICARANITGTFSVFMRNMNSTRSLVHACTLSAANTWQVFQITNLPVMPVTASGTVWNDANKLSYQIGWTVLAGSTFQNATQDTWLTGNYLAHTSQTNFGSAAGNTLDVLIFRHVPGAQLIPIVPLDYDDDLQNCQRFCRKSYPVETALGSAGSSYMTFTGPTAGSAGTYGFYGGEAFPTEMFKTPVISYYNGSNGTAGQGFIIEGTTFVSGPVGITTINATPNRIGSLAITAVAGGFQLAISQVLIDYLANAEPAV